MLARVVIDHRDESSSPRIQEKRHILGRVRAGFGVPMLGKPRLRQSIEHGAFDQAKAEPTKANFLQSRGFWQGRDALVHIGRNGGESEVVETDAIIAGYERLPSAQQVMKQVRFEADILIDK